MKFFISVLILSVYLNACSEQHKGKNRNKEWEKYFKEELTSTLQTNQVYLIVPGLVCKGCVQTTLFDIVNTTPDSILSKVICVASDTSLFPPKFNRKVKLVLYDSSHYIDRLDISLKVNNVTLLYKKADSSKYILSSNAKTHNEFVLKFQKLLDSVQMVQ